MARKFKMTSVDLEVFDCPGGPVGLVALFDPETSVVYVPLVTGQIEAAVKDAQRHPAGVLLREGQYLFPTDWIAAKRPDLANNCAAAANTIRLRAVLRTQQQQKAN